MHFSYPTSSFHNYEAVKRSAGLAEQLGELAGLIYFVTVAESDCTKTVLIFRLTVLPAQPHLVIVASLTATDFVLDDLLKQLCPECLSTTFVHVWSKNNLPEVWFDAIHL